MRLLALVLLLAACGPEDIGPQQYKLGDRCFMVTDRAWCSDEGFKVSCVCVVPHSEPIPFCKSTWEYANMYERCR